MGQVKYIAYSILLLLGAVLTYSLLKPMLQTRWIASSNNEEPIDGGGFCGTVMYSDKNSTNLPGKKLFYANCITCHSLSKVLTGPALADVETRGPWKKRVTLLKWVKNPAAFIPTTIYTQELTTEFNRQVMPAFPQLSDGEKNQIFDYIKETSLRLKQSSY